MTVWVLFLVFALLVAAQARSQFEDVASLKRGKSSVELKNLYTAHKSKHPKSTGQAKPYKLTPGEYNTKSGPVADKLNVHVVPHTHDDVGWLKTVDQYFMGANNSIQNAGVQYVLDSVTLALDANSDRKFIYVEMAFFQRWWMQQNDATKTKVRGFVKDGRLEFINGGFCMDDEASPYFVDMIDEQTLGHQFLLKEFGAVPTIGWQIDPFGHSAMQGTVFSLMGMNAWFFGRIDYQDRVHREQDSTCEVVMRSSDSLGPASDIFTGVMRGYGPIDGFDWNSGSGDAPMQDDARLNDVNIKDRVDRFVAECQEQASHYRTNNIMLSMGSDFQYENANTWFKNLDKLIHYVNLDGRVNAFYSTPSIYTKAKHDANIAWPTKTDDWFPYADNHHAFWTGYFTSRPAVKGYVRSTSNYLQICRQLELQFGNVTTSSSEQLWEAMGIAQHHDAVSGTEKQHVAFDYAQRLSKGADACKNVIDAALGQLLAPSLSPKFTDCPLLNQSSCPATTSGGSTAVLIYNPLARNRTEYIRLPIPVTSHVAVTDAVGNAVPSQLIPVPGSTSLNTLVFRSTTPAVGYNTYLLTVAAQGSALEPDQQAAQPSQASNDLFIENEYFKISFSDANGRITQILNKVSQITTVVDQNWHWYNSSDGNVADSENRGQASGAYIFRPNCTENVKTACDPFPVSLNRASVAISAGDQVQEAYQTFDTWVTQTVRLSRGMNFIEVEYTVGPIPVNDGLGKEIVSRWSTDLQSEQTFYTDSNGRDMQKRVINFRPSWDLEVTDPVAGNFYPVNAAISLKDENMAVGARQFSIMTDRSMAGASLKDGSLELMVHRRTLYDDSRGVGEPINEPGIDGKGLVITGVMRISFDSATVGNRLRRGNQDLLTFRPALSFTPFQGAASDFVRSHRMTYSGLTTSLPENIHLLTAQDNSVYGAVGEMLLRLSHAYEVGEDADLSKPVTVQLDQIFAQLVFSDCTEMTLSANQRLDSVQRYTWKTETELSAARFPLQPANGFSVTISPMEIRTFKCNYKRLF